MRFLSRQRRLLIAVLTVPALQLLLGAFLPAQAAEATLDTSDNTLLLISAAMVVLMTPGLAFFSRLGRLVSVLPGPGGFSSAFAFSHWCSQVPLCG